jgi:hypothetical protein
MPYYVLTKTSLLGDCHPGGPTLYSAHSQVFTTSLVNTSCFILSAIALFSIKRVLHCVVSSRVQILSWVAGWRGGGGGSTLTT